MSFLGTPSQVLFSSWFRFKYQPKRGVAPKTDVHAQRFRSFIPKRVGTGSLATQMDQISAFDVNGCGSKLKSQGYAAFGLCSIYQGAILGTIF